jgi:hypothetical protein
MEPVELWAIISRALTQVAKNRGQNSDRQDDCRYTIWHVVKIHLLCVLMGISPNVFYERLAKGKRRFRQQWGLPNCLISLSQFKKRLKRGDAVRALMEMLRDGARRVLRVLGKEELKVVALDLTRLESAIHDPWASWGFDSKGPFHGYKLGLIVSQQGVVLGMILMKANWTEAKAHRRLVQLARETIELTWGELPVEYAVCDAGFDGEPFARATHQVLGVPHLCPARRKRNSRSKTAKQHLAYVRRCRPHRFRCQQLWDSLPDRKSIYAKRTVVEQVNGQLNNSLDIAHIPASRRGMRRLLPFCLAKLIIFNFALNVNALEGRNLRQISRLVG